MGNVIRHIARRLFPWLWWRVTASVPSADEIPQRIPRRGIVLVRDGHRKKWVAFDCPCKGAAHRIVINLDPARRPRWTLTSQNRIASITPSVDARGPNGRCHYFITRGRTKWTPEP